MADWPPANLSHSYPELPISVEIIGPRVLVTEFEDGSELLRQKSGVTRRRFYQAWPTNTTDWVILKDFWDVYLLTQTFTALTFDPSAGASRLTEVAICRFERSPTLTQIGPNWFRSEWVLRETEL